MRSTIVLALVALVAGTACAERSGDGTGSKADEAKELIVQAASYDIAAGEEDRFIAGLLTTDQLFISYGTVQMDFTYMGTKENPSSGEAGPSATAEFLPIPGDEDVSGGDVPSAGPASRGRGVYGATVTLDEAGFWQVDVTADVDGIGKMQGSGAFEVRDKHLYPAVGDEAPNTQNLVIGDKGVPQEAIDSRFDTDGEIPDPELHSKTIAASLKEGRPVVVVISTPVYCISRFCGPITEMIAGLAKDYPKVDFVHVEVWRNFQKKVVNKSAADWVYRGGDLTEPWVFALDPKGKIVARWDNVATKAELETTLEQLSKY